MPQGSRPLTIKKIAYGNDWCKTVLTAFNMFRSLDAESMRWEISITHQPMHLCKTAVVTRQLLNSLKLHFKFYSPANVGHSVRQSVIHSFWTSKVVSKNWWADSDESSVPFSIPLKFSRIHRSFLIHTRKQTTRPIAWKQSGIFLV